MPADVGDWLTDWTARAAVGCYAARLLLRAAAAPAESRWRAERAIWTLGGAIFLLHVACAFAFVHGWSHAAAYRHTAEATARLTGLEFGGGLYVNYAFTLLWTADIAAWWIIGPEWPQRHRGIDWAVQGFFAFLVFNATAVFGPPFWRWIAAGFLALLLVVWVSRSRRRM